MASLEYEIEFRNKGYKNIDLMILSHLDSDHAGGTETILQKLNVKQLIVGKNSTKSKRFDEIKEICNNEGVKLSIVSAGSSFNIDDIKFEVLSPFSELNETENNNSVVMMMTYKEKKILFMGIWN
jgi:competence protein ComEC